MKEIKLSVSFVVFFYLILLGVNLSAQVVANYVSPEAIENRPNYFKALRAELVIMPKVNVGELIEEDIIRDKMPVPYRFGKKIYTDYDMDNSGTWYDLDDGSRLWALRISSKGAISINLIFDKFYLAKGAKFYIYNKNKSVITGPYTSELNNPQNMLGTGLVKGDEIIIEYTEPKEALGQSKLHIKTVVHGYRGMTNTKSGNFIDVNCPEGDGWQKESDAIVFIINQNGTCSGTLINNTNNDRTPYILTASHCLTSNYPELDYEFSEQEKFAVANWVFYFQYRNIECNESLSYQNRLYKGANFFPGAGFKAAWTHTDFALVELRTTPSHSGVTYAGWSRRTNNVSSSVDIHHPQSKPQKISLDYQPPVFGEYLDRPDDYYWQVNWDDGECYAGSSGSTLFNQNKKIIGQYSAIIFDEEYFGRFDISWNGPTPFDPEKSLKDWLDPILVNPQSISSICNNPPVATIIGSSLVCGGYHAYKLNNAPLGREISWSTDPSDRLTPSTYSGDTIFTVQPNNNGEVTITASFYDYCTSSQKTYSKDVWVGEPANVEIHVPVEPIIGEVEAMVWVSSDPGNETYNWQVIGGTIVQDNGDEIILIADCPSHRGLIIWVQAINNCGQSNWVSRHVAVDCSSGGVNPLSLPLLPFTLSPNPADDFVELNVTQYYEESLTAKANMKYEVRIFSTIKKPLYNQKSSKPVLRINTSDFKEGIYFVYLIIGDEVFVEQLVISH